MKYAVNIPTPSPMQKDYDVIVDALKLFVDSNVGEVAVNAAYRDIVYGPGVHRPGFAFTFWFKDEKLAETFLEQFNGVWVIEGLSKPKTRLRREFNGKTLYIPHLPKSFQMNYKFRRETMYGTQVRNSLDEEWQYFWDIDENWQFLNENPLKKEKID